MSSTNLEPFRRRHPREAEAISRLEHVLRQHVGDVFTLDQLAGAVLPRSRDELAVILGELAAVGMIGFEFQVRSPNTKEHLDSYPNPSAIPRTMRDEDNSEFVIRPTDIRPVYSVVALPR